MAEKPTNGAEGSSTPLRVLVLEDNARDAKLTAKVLEGGGASVQIDVMDSAELFAEQLERAEHDVILADFNLRGWTAFDALEILKRSGRNIPLIVVTGTLGDESAAECIKRGAADFVLKDRPARLPAAVQRALEETRLRNEKKLAEEALIEEKHLLDTLMQNLPDEVYFKDRESRFSRVNQAQAKLFGLSDPSQALGRSDFDFFALEHAQEAFNDEQEIIRTGQPVVGKEEKETWADGRVTWASTTKMPLRDAHGKIIGSFGVSRDITERKQAEIELSRLNRALRTLSRCNEILVRAQSEQELLTLVCQTVVEVGGYRMAWVGYAERDDKKTVRPVAHAGFEDGYLALGLISWGDNEYGKGPTSVAIRAGQPIVNRSTLTNPLLGHRKEEALKRGYASSIAHPLHFGTHDFGALSIYSGEPDAFDEMEVRLLSELADDLSFGIETIRTRTERLRAEAALRESEERYRLLFERNLAGVFSTTWDGRVLDCNQAMANMLGFASPREALGQRVQDLYFSVEDRAAFLARLEAEGRLTNYEMRLRRQDGNTVWLIGNLSVLPQISTSLRIIEGTLIDITERKLAEAENARLAQIVNSSEDAIFSTTPDGLIATWNAGAVRTYGYAAGEIKGKHVSSLIKEDRRRNLSGNQEKLYGGEALMHYESEHVRKDGTVLPVLLTLSPIRDAAGAVTAVSVISRDITERKQAEAERARLVTAIEQSTEAVVITNPTGEMEYVNPAFTRITGYNREDALGQNLRILKSDKQDPEFYQELWNTVIGGHPWQGELINKRKDGTLYTEQMSIAAVKDLHGEVTHFIATKQDVTERKNLEAQLQQAAKMEAVGRLAGGVAHDFNNLLTIINGYSEILLERLGSDQRSSNYLEEISKAGERAAALTRQLLAFSRRQVLAPQLVDLNSVILNLEKMLKRLIGEDVKLRTVLDTSLGKVKADPGQIEQVIMNLAVNARDAMPMGGELTFETSNIEFDESYARHHAAMRPGNFVMLAVSDTGVGMPPETKARIFEPFFTTKEQGKGTGLGLATVYGIVKQSEGSIWVYSEVGQGTVFKIYLPLVNEKTEQAKTPEQEIDLALGTETILMVEDEEGVRSLVQLALRTGGYNVLQTTDAESALETCAAYDGPIHLLLTDVVMPRMSGPVVAAKVVALRPGIKVLYMSGYTGDAVVHHGVLSENMPFIQKPFSPLALRRKIREVLGG